jgi:predicted metal-dependent phosphoesterase TrpH
MLSEACAMNPQPLLCELHAHTSWSDGSLTLTELVDLYGMHGFDVLCVTDHVVPGNPAYLTEARSARYLAAIDREGRRAREQYDLLVIPGVELTFDDADPAASAHALALGVHAWIPVNGGLERALVTAGEQGAALVAAHPHGTRPDHAARHTTRWFWHNRTAHGLVHRWELINRDQTFGWVAEADLPCIASGDFHRPEHLETWKTFLPCAKSEEAVIAYLRSPARAYVVPWHLRNAMHLAA